MLPLPLPSSVFCKVHQIKKIQMLLRHLHQIHTSCCLFLQSLLVCMFLITTTIFCSLQHASESNASLRHVHQILKCLFLPSLLNHMLVTTAIFWCPIAKTYARMYKLFFFSERGFFCVCVCVCVCVKRRSIPFLSWWCKCCGFCLCV